MAPVNTLLHLVLVLWACSCVLAQEQRRRGRQFTGEESRNLVGPGVSNVTSLNKNTESEQDVDGKEQQARAELEPGRPERFLGSDSGNFASVAALLQRQGERLSVLQSLAEQQMRRLDGLEYRLTRLEVQGQERGESSRVSKAEEARHLQTLMYQVGQLSSNLESLRQSHAEERQVIATLATSATSPTVSQGAPLAATAEILKRLQNLANLVQGVRVSVTGAVEQQAIVKNNVTELLNVTRQVRVGQEKLVSRHLLSSSLAELRHSSPLTCPLGTPQQQQDFQKLPEDCAEVQRDVGYNKSGLYLIQAHPLHPPFFAYCDLTTRGGGWTVVQHRFEGSVEFYRDWQDYKRGFGNLGGEFWLGLEKLHRLTTSKVNELLIEMQDFTLDSSHAHYSSFGVGPEVESYPISFLADYEGDAGDSLVYHAGMKFSTRDADNDQWVDGNCAESHLGAWWYNGCDTSNLNGRYLNGAVPDSHEYQGMYWYDWHGPSYSLMRTRMMVRPRGFGGEKKHKVESTTIKTPKRGGGGSQSRQRTSTTSGVLDTPTTTEPSATEQTTNQE